MNNICPFNSSLKPPGPVVIQRDSGGVWISQLITLTFQLDFTPNIGDTYCVDAKLIIEHGDFVFPDDRVVAYYGCRYLPQDYYQHGNYMNLDVKIKSYTGIDQSVSLRIGTKNTHNSSEHSWCYDQNTFPVHYV